MNKENNKGMYDNTLILKSVIDTNYNIIPITVAHIIQLPNNKSILYLDD